VRVARLDEVASAVEVPPIAESACTTPVPHVRQAVTRYLPSTGPAPRGVGL
jgi:hypothetical protein